MTEAERIAQELDKEQIDTVRRDVLNHDAAALLRSQAAEIFALKSEVLNKADYAKSMYLMHEEARAEIERLRKELQYIASLTRGTIHRIASSALENKHD